MYCSGVFGFDFNVAYLPPPPPAPSTIVSMLHDLGGDAMLKILLPKVAEGHSKHFFATKHPLSHALFSGGHYLVASHGNWPTT